jgi:hypothetical protein
MDATNTLRTLWRSGYTAAVVGGRLKLGGPRRPPAKWEALILRHREELVRLVEQGIIVDELEVFELAGEFFGIELAGEFFGIEDKEGAA